jgi:carboxypeptidase C (cathepsin A)
VRKLITVLVHVLFLVSFSIAQQPPAATPSPSPQRSPEATKTPQPEEPPVATKHEVKVGSKTLKYTVTTGMMPIKNRDGDTEARMFFMAYTLDGVSNAAERPLMFSFNGGPGSASVWLHLGALGPRRVKMMDDGMMPPPPYQLVDNDHTWLEFTDLCFIDPVGTGYSRAAKQELNQKFHSLSGDVESVGEFIRMYLTRNERWISPLFLVGESYGTTRASALSGYLFEKGIAFNGILLVSVVMNFQTLRFADGNDLPLILILPSYTATAWHHKKLPPDLQQKPLKQVLSEVERWVETEYAIGLGKGDSLTPQERKALIEKMSRYTGLSQDYIDKANLRVQLGFFNKELLRDERRTTGRLDSRFKGIDNAVITDGPESDPSLNAIRPPYTALFNQYVRSELGYKTDLEYFILGGGVGPWNWNTNNAYADTSATLKTAMGKNQFMKVFIASGYYDMATPYWATEYTIKQMNLDPALRKNISFGYYEAGHMMYIDIRELAKLKTDVGKFIQDALKK